MSFDCIGLLVGYFSFDCIVVLVYLSSDCIVLLVYLSFDCIYDYTSPQITYIVFTCPLALFLFTFLLVVFPYYLHLVGASGLGCIEYRR